MILEHVQEWLSVREALLPALEMAAGTHTEDDIIAGICAGKYKLWRSGASGLVTEFQSYPQMKCLNVFLAGGVLQDLLPLYEKVSLYAASNGCKRMTALLVNSAPGWDRALGGNTKTCGTAAYKDL